MERESSLHHGPPQEFPPKLKTPHQDLCSLKIIFVQRLYFHRFTKVYLWRMVLKCSKDTYPFSWIKQLSDSPMCWNVKWKESAFIFREIPLTRRDCYQIYEVLTLVFLLSWHGEASGMLQPCLHLLGSDIGHFILSGTLRSDPLAWKPSMRSPWRMGQTSFTRWDMSVPMPSDSHGSLPHHDYNLCAMWTPARGHCSIRVKKSWWWLKWFPLLSLCDCAGGTVSGQWNGPVLR